MIEAL